MYISTGINIKSLKLSSLIYYNFDVAHWNYKSSLFDQNWYSGLIAFLFNNILITLQYFLFYVAKVEVSANSHDIKTICVK